MEYILVPICVILLVFAFLIAVYGWWIVLIGVSTLAALALAFHAATVLHDNWFGSGFDSDEEAEDPDAPPNYRSH